ncbi:sarcosine oxidase subunit gamma family protein [Loktanella sp. SALINAS62]|uniref:sarcosine oxidase subunit gamma n=1 Tax=Loktanella sp. SALINAS62 TaxID=2706124 RepID=UPI001B8C373D|nr:sarcosine oxidase subunit gamma family protein [Loktanella sp. SALINAS62]MBS1303547.1 sarcosine oxidase subunit gamma [Loktanella sp. SALINAS62]
MSEPISALRQRETSGSVQIRDTGLRGMITLRGDLSHGKLGSTLKQITGQKMPGRNAVTLGADTGLAWMSPDELLVMVPYAGVRDALDKIAKTMAGQHHLAVDVSDARSVMLVEGPFAREVIAKLAPVDLHPDVWQPGTIIRSRLGQVAAAFWLRDPQTVEVICFRSVADYAFDLLAASAKAGPVGHFQRGI